MFYSFKNSDEWFQYTDCILPTEDLAYSNEEEVNRYKVPFWYISQHREEKN